MTAMNGGNAGNAGAKICHFFAQLRAILTY